MPEMQEIAYLCSNKLFDFQKMPEKTPSNSDRKAVTVGESQQALCHTVASFQ